MDYIAYRGRLAPTPSGYLHLGHAYAFAQAAQRAEEAKGALLLRMEDIDGPRCRAEYAEAALEDLQWLSFNWQEGPDLGGPYGPYTQSERMPFYLHTWVMLRDLGLIYPSPHSRREIAEAQEAREGVPVLTTSEDEQDAEPLFPKALRGRAGAGRGAAEPGEVNWRFRVPDGLVIEFTDALAGPQSFVAGRDFGDFLVWRKDGMPSYELAVVVDDHAMLVTEVVRGADLLRSTARQLLLYRALNWTAPRFAHVPLVRDEQGKRLAKRSDSLSIRQLRQEGLSPVEVLTRAENSLVPRP